MRKATFTIYLTLVGALFALHTPTFGQNMPKLRSGDTVAVVAPAAFVKPEQMETFINYFETNGFNVIVAPQVYLDHLGFAGTVHDRYIAFQEMLDRPDVKAIICARGGYGSVQIIDSLDFTEFRKHPKWICGFSDITALLSHLYTLGYPSLHSPMPITMRDSTAVNNAHNSSLVKALRGERLHYEFPATSQNHPGEVIAPVVGGNLSLLYSLLCSESDINTDGTILFIEDCDENIYHIERMLIALDRAGKFKNLKGLIVGCMSRIEIDDYYPGYTVNKLIAELFQKYDYPICFDFPAGHCRPNFTLIIGKTATLKVTNNPSKDCFLTFE